jgi:hypothetical protein
VVGAVVLALSLPGTEARPATGGLVALPVVTSNSIDGVVTRTKGREAGVWVIAETTGLTTKFVKIVATDHLRRRLSGLLQRDRLVFSERKFDLIVSC